MIEFSSPDLEALARDLVAAPAKLRADVGRVVKRGAQNIKVAAQAAAPNPHNAGMYRASITYDITDGGSAAEIGPDKDRPQGALGNLFEFGSARGAAQPHLMPAFEAEEPRFIGAIEDAAEGALG
jgi:HK97 gp10 family phage protein